MSHTSMELCCLHLISEWVSVNFLFKMLELVYVGKRQKWQRTRVKADVQPLMHTFGEES